MRVVKIVEAVEAAAGLAQAVTGERRIPVENGAEALVEVLSANGVEYLFTNTGTDHAAILEALAKYEATGRRPPRAILCMYENVAMHAAHGYAAATGRPQAVLVHVDVGTQNVGGALHNACRARVPVLLMAGAAPMTGRIFYIHWLQERADQGGIVRQYVKWDYQVRQARDVNLALQRAIQVAREEPCGPVYLALPSDVMIEPLDGMTLLPPERFQPPVPTLPPMAELQRMARALLTARNPLIITTYLGRQPAAVPELVRLAEAVGAPVIESLPAQYMNFPSDHPLHLGSDVAPYLAQADVICLLDCDVPWVSRWAAPAPGARILQLDIDPVKRGIPTWDFPVDLKVAGDSRQALPVLAALIEEEAREADRRRFAERRQRWEQESRERRARIRQAALAKSHLRPIEAEWLAYVINQVKDEDTILVDETVTTGRIELLDRTRPGTYFTSGGSSLGWGLGAALGIKLACPDREVICLTGDGSYVFASPVAAHWAAVQGGVPYLTVIYNNQCYNAVKFSIFEHFPQGWAARTGRFPGSDLSPAPDYAAIARACGLYAETVEEPQEVKAALERSRERVRAGQPALLNVLLRTPQYP
ncbi:MAG: thiamine pyrophosphate-requiring protein [Deltaproteobacteria bacterium]|nr:thiamine pyrophosphate-requiring protein [Deltaproteobacteria bacterium]